PTRPTCTRGPPPAGRYARPPGWPSSASPACSSTTASSTCSSTVGTPTRGAVLVLKYTVYRLAFYLVALLILLMVELHSIWAVVFAALFSMVTSLFLLVGPCEEAARDIEAKLEKSRSRRAEKLSAQRTDEDDEDAEASDR